MSLREERKEFSVSYDTYSTSRTDIGSDRVVSPILAVATRTLRTSALGCQEPDAATTKMTTRTTCKTLWWARSKILLCTCGLGGGLLCSAAAGARKREGQAPPLEAARTPDMWGVEEHGGRDRCGVRYG